MGEYHDTLHSFMNDFKRQFGERAYYSISETIANSNKVSVLINLSKEKHIAPTSGDIVPCVMSMLTFMFANNMKVAAASVLVLERWNQECNQEEGLLSDYDLFDLFRSILRECGQML